MKKRIIYLSLVFYILFSGKINICLFTPSVFISEAEELNVNETLCDKEMSNKERVNCLLTLLKDHDKENRAYAVYGLEQLKDIRTIKFIIEALADEDITVRALAQNALVEFGQQAVPFLIEAMEHPNVDIRGGAVVPFAFGKIQDKQAIQPLISLLKDDNTIICTIAFKALTLQDIVANKDIALPPLISLLETEQNRIIRLFVLELLGEIGDWRAADVVIQAQNDENEEVRKTATKAFVRIAKNSNLTPEQPTNTDTSNENHFITDRDRLCFITGCELTTTVLTGDNQDLLKVILMKLGVENEAIRKLFQKLEVREGIQRPGERARIASEIRDIVESDIRKKYNQREYEFYRLGYALMSASHSSISLDNLTLGYSSKSRRMIPTTRQTLELTADWVISQIEHLKLSGIFVIISEAIQDLDLNSYNDREELRRLIQEIRKELNIPIER